MVLWNHTKGELDLGDQRVFSRKRELVEGRNTEETVYGNSYVERSNKGTAIRLMNLELKKEVWSLK